MEAALVGEHSPVTSLETRSARSCEHEIRGTAGATSIEKTYYTWCT